MSGLYNGGLRVNGYCLRDIVHGFSIYISAIEVIADRARIFTKSRIHCEGCEKNCPSKSDHDCAMLIDKYFEQYLCESLKTMGNDIVADLVRERSIEQLLLTEQCTVNFTEEDLNNDTDRWCIVEMYYIGRIPLVYLTDEEDCSSDSGYEGECEWYI